MFETNFLKEMNKMREQYRKHPYVENHIPKPEWLKPEDRLSVLYQEYQELFAKGQVYYGCVAQANTILFEDYPPIDCPAYIVYSADAAVDDNPNLLQCVANAVMLYKDAPQEKVPEGIQLFVDVVNDEKSRRSAKQKFAFEDGTEITVYLKAMIVFRKYLPERKITSGLHPVLANIGQNESIITLPEKYLTRKVKKFMKEKK